MLEHKMRIISAGAGSGKTHRLTEELGGLLKDGKSGVRPEGIVATTFTRKAAAELVERLRQALFTQGKHAEAERLSAGYVSTVNGVCGSLLQRVAFEAGISPRIEVIAEEDQQVLFNNALAEVILDERVDILERISERLGDINWRSALKNIVDAARGNNCRSTDLAMFAKKSLDGLKAYLPKQSARTAEELDGILIQTVRIAIHDIRNNTIDETAGTKSYLDMLETMDSKLKHGHLSWSEWVKITKTWPTQKSTHLAVPVQQAALAHAGHPRFHQDIEVFITTLFDLSRAAIDQFQMYKLERGLLDFVDQEALLLKALDLPEVRDRLKDELDLLLVDEFQDTSPIQLAMFLKLTEVVQHAIWVGDPKQSIYAFRGADPALMAAVVKAIPIRPGDIQETSYRSRSDLVRFANALFMPAFSAVLPPEQIALKSHRQDPSGSATALRLWKLLGKNAENRANEIADGIIHLITEAPVIHDKQAKEDRNSRPGDIAVLCRRHTECSAIAKALEARGVRVAIGRPGLLQTPEGKLTLACIRYFLNEFDTLANAEIQVLTSTDPKPEEWLTDRLAWLRAGNPSHEWGKGHAVLEALRRLSMQAINFSPSEVVDEIIEAVDLRRLLIGWGERERRLGNLENLRALVRSYEESCRRQMAAASTGGFLLWLEDLANAEGDEQAQGRGRDAVNIMTCHAAKGLEWPIVVVAALDAKIRDRVWNVVVVDDRKDVDLTRPLSGRWIRYWPWPYGQQKNDTGLLEAMQGKDVLLKARKSAEEEELRLLYVTLTRARDYMILCLNPKGNPWLELALSKAELELQPPNEDRILQLPWKVPGAPISIQVNHPPEPSPIALADKPSLRWVIERQGRKDFPPFRLNPSAMTLPEGLTVQVDTPEIIGKRIAVNGKPAYELLGSALHAFIAVDYFGIRDRSIRIAMLDDLLKSHDVADSLNPEDVLENCDGLYHFIEQFNPVRVFTEWPLQMKVGNQTLVGTADMLLDTPSGWVVIDHKSFPGMPSQWIGEAARYGAQFKAYSDTLTLATGRKVIGTYVNFVLGGEVLRLDIVPFVA
jgi:ATP-dependent exoDNAse (exonuclease V) beta subunit